MKRLHRVGLAAGVALACAPLPAAALPLISEVYYDAVGSDDGVSFVELFGTPGTPLDGLVVEGINGANGAPGPTLALAGAIPADGIFVLADALADGSTQVANADLLANFDFQNGPDSIVLRSGSAVLDAVGYGVFLATEIFAGEGSPAEDGAPGTSLARLFADLDTENNALDFAVLATPTPGVAPLLAPEPSTWASLGAGLALLARASAAGRRAPRAAG
jgi:hypothetical protein